MLQVKPSMVPALKQASMAPMSQITYVMQSEAFSGNILNLKTALQHRHVLGALVFYQLKNRTGSVATASAIDYNVN